MSSREIPGFSGFEWLYSEFARTAPVGAVAVEIGVALGHSIAFLCEELDAAKRYDVTVYAVDPWAGVARNGEQQTMVGEMPGGDFALFCRMMLEHCPAALSRIQVLRMMGHEATRIVRSADLVMIDGAHDFASVCTDIGAWVDKIRPGGIMAGDDHEPNYPGVERACCLAWGKDGYEVTGTTWWKRWPLSPPAMTGDDWAKMTGHRQESR